MFFLKIFLLLFIISVVIFFKKLFSQNHKESKTDKIGKEGELAVSNILNSLPENYKVFNDLMLFGSKGTIQIDHIVLSKNGIFVIETKNYKGEVFGYSNEKNWKKINHDKEISFYNPILQNKAHISTLKMILQEKNEAIFIPIVAFSDECNVSIQNNDSKNLITNFSNLCSTIKNFNQEKLSNEQLLQIESKIKSLRLDSKKYEKKHIQTIKKSIATNGKYSEYGNCPSCNGLLILHNGNKGFFLGCENYPKCKFTKDF